MNKEQAAFGERLRRGLREANIEASPVMLAKLLARHGGTPVTSQAISGWLSGKHMPKQANMRALAALLKMEPQVLQFGADKRARSVREPRAAWPPHLGGQDRLVFEEFGKLPAQQRKLVRELIQALVDVQPVRAKRLKP